MKHQGVLESIYFLVFYIKRTCFPISITGLLLISRMKIVSIEVRVLDFWYRVCFLEELIRGNSLPATFSLLFDP